MGNTIFHTMAEGLVQGEFKHNTFHCALYFYYYIGSTSDHPLLDSRDWGRLLSRQKAYHEEGVGGFLESDSRNSGLVAWSGL